MLTHTGTVTLTTPRLILRRFRLDDAQAIYDNWGTDENVTKYLTGSVHESVSATGERLTKWIADYDHPETYHWAIEIDGVIVGKITLHMIDNWSERCELGYCIGSKWWNRGIMTEAVAGVLRFAFEELNAHKICAQYDTENIGSGKVMLKNGMKPEGVLREHCVRKDGTRGDMACYAILKGAWETCANEASAATANDVHTSSQFF